MIPAAQWSAWRSWIVESENLALEDLKVIWTQTPKVTGRGHYSHRMVFSPDGKYLFHRVRRAPEI